MSIKDNALLVSISVNKPQMTAKDNKATSDAESANDAHGAGQYRKDLYPKHLIAPIIAVESAARAYVENTTYQWGRGEFLLPVTRFMEFTTRIGKFELEFSQCVTAFLNNWSNVLQAAQQTQGGLFDASNYPDLMDMRNDFRFRVLYRPVTDMNDFRVQCQEEELDTLRTEVERATKEATENMLRSPLLRLQKVVAKLHEVTGKVERATVNKRTGHTEHRPPIFRDSVVENISEEIALLHDFAAMLPDDLLAVAKQVADATPHPQTLRDDPTLRAETNVRTSKLLSIIDDMLN